jgi:prevent-host-death family protein
MKTSAKDLRIHAKRLLEAVERGEEITITHRGRPCARLIPVGKQRRTRKKASELSLFGMWKDYDATRHVTAYVDKLRSGRH